VDEETPSAFQPDAAIKTPGPGLTEEMNPIWLRAQHTIRGALDASKYATWFEALTPLSMTDGVFRIATPNRFVQSWIREHYQDQIAQALEQSLGAPCQVAFVVTEPAGTAPNETVTPSPSATVSPRRAAANGQTMFNPRLTFDTFVVGSSNAFAHAACLAVAQHPAQTYNPLFIYGDVGLGKTHLLHAMGNHLAQHEPHLMACYVSSETFLNDLVSALSHDKMDAFRNRYQQCDLILVDDVQFLMGKERTQEEFFHTFNILHQEGKQIILSSDKPPKEMRGLERRLRSRFEWGLVADLQAPDLETKVAILKNKAGDRQMAVPDDVAWLIAQRLRGDVRHLEGALNRLEADTKMTGQGVTADLVLSLMGEIAEAEAKPTSIGDIQRVVTDHYHLSGHALRSRTRTKEIAHARHIAMYLVRMQTHASLPQVGKAFGNRDHTSVLHACNKVQSLIQDDGCVKEEVDQLLRTLQG